MSFIHEHKGVPVTPWNPGLGVAFGLIVLRGAAYGLVLFACVVIAEIFVLQTDLAWPVILAIATVVAASYTGAAVIARVYLRLDVGLSHVRDVRHTAGDRRAQELLSSPPCSPGCCCRQANSTSTTSAIRPFRSSSATS